MPYYVHEKEKAIADVLVSGDYLAFDERALAHETAKKRSMIVTFQVSDDERDKWRERECERVRAGVYIPTPWSGYDRFPDHFAHMSVKQPGMIAYTENDEKGIADRQTTIKPGRYLEQFYSDWTKAVRDRYCGDCSAEFQTLQFASTADEIEAVYTADNAPDSCMSHGLDEYSGHCHPVRVYGGKHSDLVIAWCGDLDKDTVKARAICWPDKKRYGRVYGHESLLRSLLEAEGYSNGSMKGAKVAAIKDDNGHGWIMPYIDGISVAKLAKDQKSFVLGEGSTTTCETCGTTHNEPEYDFTCDTCGGNFTDDDYAGDGLCNACDEHMITCAECNGRYDDRREDFTETRNGQFCDACASAATATCAIDDCGDTWIETAEFTSRETREREQRNVVELCRTCADSHDHCSECDNYTERGSLTCDECGSADVEHGRCEHTIELPIADVDTSAATFPLYRLERYATTDPIVMWRLCHLGSGFAESTDRDLIIEQYADLRRLYPHEHYRVLVKLDANGSSIVGLDSQAEYPDLWQSPIGSLTIGQPSTSDSTEVASCDQPF